MNTSTIIRAWKDAAYRQSLSDAERALLPENPAGVLELTEAELAQVAGGRGRQSRSGGRSGGRSRGGSRS